MLTYRKVPEIMEREYFLGKLSGAALYIIEIVISNGNYVRFEGENRELQLILKASFPNTYTYAILR